MFPKISIDLGEISIKNVSGIFQSRLAFKITNFLKDFTSDIVQVDPLKHQHFRRVYQRCFLEILLEISAGSCLSKVCQWLMCEFSNPQGSYLGHLQLNYRWFFTRKVVLESSKEMSTGLWNFLQLFSLCCVLQVFL